jgi:16S rRNA processing protein RimM
MNDIDLISIGIITRHQGNKGEVRVLPLTDSPERYELLDSIYLVNGDNILMEEIEDIYYHRQFVILKLAGINSIEEAAELRDYLIKIKEDDLLPLAEGEYYVYQLVGFKVITDQGNILGQLTDVEITGGTDIFYVQGESRDYLIPAAREIVTGIDQEKKIIKINPIPGLLDL